MIQIQNVTKRYGRRAALADVSLTIRPGEVTLLLGPNGAGKSTLLRCILGITDFEGQVRVAGIDPLADGRNARALVGYVPQSGGLHHDLTVEDTVDFYASLRRIAAERGRTLLAEVGLAEHQSVKVRELSGGMRQRLGFALALLSDPDILVLDEPSASLDAASREWLAVRLREIAAEGRTVLLSTHSGQELLAAGDRAITLEDGRVVSDTRPIATEITEQTEITEARNKQGARAASAAPIVRKELSDAVRNRWLAGYAVVLGVLGLAAAATGLDSSQGLALQAFGRTTATLMNLCLLLAPLVAVVMGAASIAGERDRGTLEHLLAQPLTRTALLVGKHAGLVISLAVATIAGFLPAGLMVTATAGPGVLGHYLLFPAIASALGAAMAAVGLLVSVSSRTAVQAQGLAMFVWFAFVLLYDLLLMGTLAVSGMPVELLTACLAANPVDAARVVGVLALEPDLYLLGPAGAYLTAQFGRGGAAALLVAALALWATVPVFVSILRFRLPRVRAPRRAAAGVASMKEVTSS